MGTQCLVTIDAGTGSGRCVVYDERGRPLASARERFHYRSFTHPDVPFVRGFDLDPAVFWRTLAGCVRTALAALPPGSRIAGVAATSQREACVFLDRAGEVIYAGPNLDARATLEGFEVQQAVGVRRLHEITGHLPACVFPIARYLWFRKHDDAERVASVLMLSDWITERLCGARVAEPSNAAESMFVDVSRRAWSPELLGAFDVPASILPALHPSGAEVGRVDERGAADTGLPPGTPVFTGGADTQCALLGSGAVAPGDVAAIIGSTCPVQMVTSRPVLDLAANLWTSCHVAPDRWVLESNAGETGGAYRWLLRLLLGESDAAAHEMAEAAAAAATRQVLCYLGPIVFDLRKMNPFRPGGLLFRFPIVHADRPERGDVLRGFLENVAFAIRANLEQVAAVAGRSADALTVSGGMVASPTLVRLLADVTGRPIDVATVPETASLGCAVLIAAGAGVHASLAEAIDRMTARARTLPSPAAVATMDERYRKWRELYATLEQCSV